MFRQHSSNTQLLSYLDGELTLRAERAVRKHLKVCWKCRSQLATIEDQVRKLADAIEEDPRTGPAWVVENQMRFAKWVERVERDFAPPPNLWLLSASIGTKTRGLAASVILLFTVGLCGWLLSNHSAVNVVAVMAAARSVEASLNEASLPVQQVFRVDVRQLKPSKRTQSSRLEVWTDLTKGRFSSRWTNSEGALRYAVWQPDTARKYRHDPTSGTALVGEAGRSTDGAFLAELSRSVVKLDGLETGFMRWLESRRWTPILLVSYFHAFCDQEGVVLRVERARSHNDRSVFRLSALRNNAGRRVEVVMEVDAQTYCPRLQSIRLESPGQAAELRLIVERFQVVPRHDLREAMFRVDVPYARPKGPRRKELASPAFESEIRSTLDPTELTVAEIETRYVLHRARSCLGEPVEVVRDPGGLIRVRGLVETNERKEQLLTELWSAVPFATINIQTADEVAKATPPATRPGPVVTIVGGRLPIQDEFKRYFAEGRHLVSAGARQPGVNPLSVDEEIGRLSNEAIALSEAVYAEAWSLRRLAEAFSSEDFSNIPLRPRWLLEMMARDHITSLGTKMGRIRALLEPVLSPVIREGPAGPKRVGTEPSRRGDPTESTWVPGSHEIFRTVQEIDRLLHSLFSGAEVPEPGPKEAARKVWYSVSSLEQTLQTIEAQVAKAVSARSAELSAEEKRPESMEINPGR